MIFQSFQYSVTCLLIKLLEMMISVHGVLWIVDYLTNSDRGGWVDERERRDGEGWGADRQTDRQTGRWIE